MKRKDGMVAAYALIAMFFVIMLLTIASINVFNSFNSVIDLNNVQYDYIPDKYKQIKI